MDWAAIVCNDVASAGEARAAYVGVFAMPGTGEVSIDVHVEASGRVRAIKEALISGVEQVVANTLDGLFMEASWTGEEACAVVDRHADVRACHLGEEGKFANKRSVVPEFLPRGAGCVWVQNMDDRSVFRRGLQ